MVVIAPKLIRKIRKYGSNEWECFHIVGADIRDIENLQAVHSYAYGNRTAYTFWYRGRQYGPASGCSTTCSTKHRSRLVIDIGYQELEREFMRREGVRVVSWVDPDTAVLETI
jgi:hypothetical protein